MYIHYLKNYPKFHWDSSSIINQLSEARNLQGRILSRMESIGFKLREEASLNIITADLIKSNEIEGNILDNDKVRSSIARKLGVEISGMVSSDRYIDGVVDMMLDATQNYDKELTKNRLFGWHNCLFPTGKSGMHDIIVANWRDDKLGVMQVVSGAMGREKVHYQAPNAHLVDEQMNEFIEYFNKNTSHDSIIKAAILHLWFVIVHPFDDGNGRIARAITDMQLSRSDNTKQRFYSMSSEINNNKKSYYDILGDTSKGDLDITPWITWFIDCFEKALLSTDIILEKTLKKADFWKKHNETIFNERQQFMINKLQEDFFGKLTSSKWAKLTKCSTDTSLRDIKDMIKKQILMKEDKEGRSTSYCFCK